MKALVRLCACAGSSDQSLGCVYNKYQNLELAQQFPFGYIFHSYIYLIRTLRKQTVETLIRRRNLRRLIWVFTFCLCSTKMMLGLFRLKRVLSRELPPNHSETMWLMFTNYYFYNSYDCDNLVINLKLVIFYIFNILFLYSFYELILHSNYKELAVKCVKSFFKIINTLDWYVRTFELAILRQSLN